MGKYDAEIAQERNQIWQKQQILNLNYPVYREIIEQYMYEEKYEQIANLFKVKEVLEIAQMNNEFAVLNIIVNIYWMEVKEEKKCKIWDQMHSIEEIEKVFLSLKMLMWRLEFTEDQKAFINYVLKHKISVSYIKWLIHTSSFQKADTALKIAKQYKEQKYYLQAFEILNYLNELSDEQEFIYCEMADICIQMQQYQAAADCIKKIQKPSVFLQQYKRKWGLTDE